MSLRLSDAADPPAGLSTREVAALRRLRHAARRDEWIAARRLAKHLARRGGLIADWHPDEAVSVLPSDPERSARPRLFLASGSEPATELDVDVSIAHAAGWVAVTLSRDVRVGVDLVQPSDVRESRLVPWMSRSELALARDESLHLAELWAMKEAAFKATSSGNPFRPTEFPVVADRGWRCGPCAILMQPLGRLTLALASPDASAFRSGQLLLERRRVTPHRPHAMNS